MDVTVPAVGPAKPLAAPRLSEEMDKGAPSSSDDQDMTTSDEGEEQEEAAPLPQPPSRQQEPAGPGPKGTQQQQKPSGKKRVEEEEEGHVGMFVRALGTQLARLPGRWLRFAEFAPWSAGGGKAQKKQGKRPAVQAAALEDEFEHIAQLIAGPAKGGPGGADLAQAIKPKSKGKKAKQSKE